MTKDLLKKTKLLYKLLNISTQVLHIDEFAKHLPTLLNSFETSTESFMHFLISDANEGRVIDEYFSTVYECDVWQIEISHMYLGFFKKMERFRKNNVNIILLTKEVNNYSYFTFYSEFAGVTNNCTKLFGLDNNADGNFVEKDLRQIKSGTWTGRHWIFNNAQFFLHVNTSTKIFGLLIIPFVKIELESPDTTML